MSRVDKELTLYYQEILKKGMEDDGYIKPSPFVRKFKQGRNDKCPCGSGKKYKKCCWYEMK